MESEGVVLTKGAEIDTRAPFRSVKEAVELFGERILAGEVYTNKRKEMRAGASDNGCSQSRQGTVTAELEETKQSLQKATEESMSLVNCLSSLREELEQTKWELQQMKMREVEKQLVNSDTEDIKFVENATGIEVTPRIKEEGVEFQKRRYVKFANPPLAQVHSPERSAVLERHPSLRRKKKKSLIPFIGGLFSRKKGVQEAPGP